MDKNAIKKYAVWARRELISRVSQRAALYEITDKGYGDASADSVLGRVMSAEEKRQRQALIAQIREKGYEQVMEEIAYTWFNRFIALRFMEVNGYLPSRVRVFTDDENNFKPQILTEAINMELDGLDMEKVYALKNANDDDALFMYMIIVQCNALSSILPGMFQRISDYTELLFPDNLLREGSVIEQMVAMIPEEDWTDQVQIIGWLYQYYNTEPKEKVFADQKKNIKISKENIPAATQLFTPDWIVRYMVENSLGRLWLEGHPNDELKASWKYYLEEAEQEPDVQAQLAEIRKEYVALKPEDILAIDPCQGSGHILSYMFDVLVQIYESYGYTAREAAASIVAHNLWGLDIDSRATQLAYFSIMMKARQYDRRFFSRGIQPHVYATQESNNIEQSCLDYFVGGNKELAAAMTSLCKEMLNAKEFGSILDVPEVNFSLIYRRIDEIKHELEPTVYAIQVIETVSPFVDMCYALAQHYHVVVTNPPYMGSNGMADTLAKFIKKKYPDSKSDLSTVFMEKAQKMCSSGGFWAMINIPVWMFISSYEKLRGKLIAEAQIVNMLHLGRGIFGADFGTTSFVVAKNRLKHYESPYLRLFERQGEVNSIESIEQSFLERKNLFLSTQDDFEYLPGTPIAYWAGKELFEAYKSSLIGDGHSATVGIQTGDNNRFLKCWFEVPFDEISFDRGQQGTDGYKWYPHPKGGAFRKWYGNLEYVVNWENNGEEIKEYNHANISIDKYYRNGLCWSHTTSGAFSARIFSKYSIPNLENPVLFCENAEQKYLLGLMNSNIVNYLLNLLNSTLHYHVGDILRIPYKTSSEDAKVIELVDHCLALARADWDAFELSWDYKRHPFIGRASSISKAFSSWNIECEERVHQLCESEETLNSYFANLYGLTDVSDKVEDKYVTVRHANLQRDVKSFISYAVGCMLGRYSLDIDGLAFSGGEWDSTVYKSYVPDADGILPICDDEYFEDDIVGLFIKFVETVFGKGTLDENLKFIADALGGNGNPRDIIRSYFLNDFYTDHCTTYSVTGSGKRPIYWLFDSGKKNGFKCLIYMHRYQPDTIARIRTDYVHEQQSRYRTAIADLESRIANAGTGERVKLSKQLTKLQEQAEELRVYEEKIHHLADQMIRIDLDDGVKHNYAIFQDVLAKIK